MGSYQAQHISESKQRKKKSCITLIRHLSWQILICKVFLMLQLTVQVAVVVLVVVAGEELQSRGPSADVDGDGSRVWYFYFLDGPRKFQNFQKSPAGKQASLPRVQRACPPFGIRDVWQCGLLASYFRSFLKRKGVVISEDDSLMYVSMSEGWQLKNSDLGAVNGFCGDFMFQKFHVIHLNPGDGLMSMYLSSSFRRQKRGSVDGITEGIIIFFYYES